MRFGTSTTASRSTCLSTSEQHPALPGGAAPASPPVGEAMPDAIQSLSTARSASPRDAKVRQRFSDVLHDLASRPDATISIGDVLDAFGDRAFGALMLLFAAPNVLPLPPGTSALLGAPLLFVTAQLMIGRSTLWMPSLILKRSISREFATLVAKLGPALERTERVLRPRLTALLNPIPERIAGAACLLLGLATVVGWVTTLGSLLILAAISSAIVAGVNAFFEHLWLIL
jgi:Exopolysaccharide synthesis, ExoD